MNRPTRTLAATEVETILHAVRRLRDLETPSRIDLADLGYLVDALNVAGATGRLDAETADDAVLLAVEVVA